ncbi:MarR family winged helix-turn-helix transcriptional regulator [Catenulispora yoronensis]
MSEHTSAHSAEHEDDDDQELVPASGGSLAGRGHRPVRYRPSTGYLPWLLTMCDRELARHMTRLLAELDLTEAQYGVLQALVHLRRASSATLARSVSVTPQAMVGLVAALERKGYITREFGRGPAASSTRRSPHAARRPMRPPSAGCGPWTVRCAGPTPTRSSTSWWGCWNDSPGCSAGSTTSAAAAAAASTTRDPSGAVTAPRHRSEYDTTYDTTRGNATFLS